MPNSSHQNGNNTQHIDLLKNSTISTITHANIEEICPITYEQFQEGNIVTTLPCGHMFTRDPLNNWLHSHHTCPTCRYDLRESESETVSNTNESASDQWRISHAINVLMNYQFNHPVLNDSDDDVSDDENDTGTVDYGEEPESDDDSMDDSMYGYNIPRSSISDDDPMDDSIYGYNAN